MVEKIGDLLLREMQTKNITEMEMASRLGVSPGAMSTEEAIECPVRYCYRYPVKRKVNKKTQPTSAPR